MKIRRLQNVFILFLVVLTFLQTGELWFGGTPNRNFFYSFLSPDANASAAENLPDLSKPYRVAASFAQDNYLLKYSDLDTSDQKKALDAAINALFANGEYIGLTEMDWTALGTSLLYEYACDIPATAFTGAYKQKTNLLSARFDVFNRIMLIPGETVRVLFHIAATDQCHEFTITDSDLTTQLLMARENISVANNQLYYIASSAYRANLFSDHVFIPVWDSEALAYANIEKINPYADDNNIILNDTVENNINMFFNNPARKQNARINDVLTFSDETTVVKYHQSNVLECNNYQTVDDSITTTFASAYNQAVGFIKRDTTITENDDYYLADYKQDPNGNWLLYFDFTVNDLPVFISNRGGSTPELAHAIEITVSHDIVTKYMRSAFLYRASEQSISEVTVNGMDALNTACANYALPEDEGGEVEYPELIQSIDLGYSIDNSDSTSLYWYIGYTGITRPYAFSANYRGEE